MKKPLTPAGIESATVRFVTQHSYRGLPTLPCTFFNITYQKKKKVDVYITKQVILYGEQDHHVIYTGF